MKNKNSRYFNKDEKLIVGIELTNHCNFYCPICPVSYRKENNSKQIAMAYNRPLGFMELYVFERALEECKRVAKHVNFGFFGEQTLHKNFIFMIKKLKNRNFKVDINTNMSVVTNEIMLSWIESELDFVKISIDAYSQEIYNKVRPGRVVDIKGNKVGENDRLKTIKEKIIYWLNLPDRRPTQLIYVKSSFNKYQNEKEDFVKFWKPFLGEKDRILCKKIISYGGKISDSEIVKGECNIWESKYLMIDWRGMVTPCNLDINLDLSLGSILEDTIENLYYGDKASDLRKFTGCENEIIPCKTCLDSNNWKFNEYFEK